MMTQRTKTTAAVVLFLVAFWLWVSELPLTPDAAVRPLPDANADDDADNVRRVDFSERKAKAA